LQICLVYVNTLMIQEVLSDASWSERLITSFLVSVIAGISVWVLIFNVRSILRSSSFGRSGVFQPSGYGHAPSPRSVPAAHEAPGVADATWAAVLPAAGASQRMVHASDGARNAIDRVRNERNEAGRQEAGLPPFDSRGRNRKAFDKARTVAAVAGSYASMGAGAAMTAGKVAGG
jgi:hypothetical protein